MFRQILVPIDGSPTSNLGLQTAIGLAKEQKAALCLLHVVDEMVVTQGLDGMTYLSAGYVDEFLDALRKEGKRLLARAEAQAGKRKIKCQTVLAETIGHGVADVIVEQAAECGADLIVLGTHGRRGIRRLVLGSDAEGVVRTAPVPVLLVRAPSRARRVKRAKRS